MVEHVLSWKKQQHNIELHKFNLTASTNNSLWLTF